MAVWARDSEWSSPWPTGPIVLDLWGDGLQVDICGRAKQASLCSESKKRQEWRGSFNYFLGHFSSNLKNLLLCLLLLRAYCVVCALYVRGFMYHHTSVEAGGLPSLLPPSHELQGLNSVSRLVRQALLYRWAILWLFLFFFVPCWDWSASSMDPI